MKEYIMYLRKSQMDRDFDDLSVEETLNRHRKILTEFVKEKKIPVSEILEEVVSGESLSGRPQMMKCLELINTGNFAGVVCMDIDRLSRGSSLDSGYIMQVLQLNHCKIITPGKTYDLENESDEQFTDMKFLFSRYELKTITKRLCRGRDVSASEGKFLGSIPPYGYDIVKLSGVKGNTLKPNPQEVPIVQLIFNMYTQERIGYNTIAYRLNQMGLKARSGKEWTQTPVVNIITNPVCIGKIRWKNSPQKKKIEDGKVIKKRITNNDPEIYDGLQEPIISEEQFELAQQIRKEKEIPSNKKERQLANPFADLMFCEKCGKPIKRNTYSHRQNCPPRYRCPSQGCECKSIYCSDVEETVLKEMRQWLNDYIIHLDQKQIRQDNDLTSVRDSLQEHLHDLKEQQNKICDLLEKGVYTVDLFTKRNVVLQNDIDQTTSALDDLNVQIQKQQSQQTAKSNIIPTTQHLLDNYENLTPKEKNSLWKTVLEKITYFRPETGGSFRVVIYPKLPKN